MPIDPVKIPQNVYIEDRIVGPLTLRQTIIMAVGGGFSYMMFAAIQKTYGSVTIPVTVLVWIPAVVAVAFALIKVNDLSLVRICFLMLERFHKPSTRTFSPRRGISINIRVNTQKVEDDKVSDDAFHLEEQKATAATKTQKNIRELSSILDSKLHAPIVAAIESVAPKAASTAEAEDPLDQWDAVSEAPEERRPVDPSRIKTDSQAGNDLSVFRDIFPENK